MLREIKQKKEREERKGTCVKITQTEEVIFERGVRERTPRLGNKNVLPNIPEPVL